MAVVGFVHPYSSLLKLILIWVAEKKIIILKKNTFSSNMLKLAYYLNKDTKIIRLVI